MTEEHFNLEMGRLYGRWGNKAYHFELVKLIWRSVCMLQDQSFTRVVNHFLSSFRQPPLPKDFLEAAKVESRRSFQRDVEGAVGAVFNYANQEGLRSYLDKNYPGCKSLWDAVQVERLRLQCQEARNQP